MIVKCSCEHKGQDELHGAGMRVANQTNQNTAKDNEYRCTVCLKTHTVFSKGK